MSNHSPIRLLWQICKYGIIGVLSTLVMMLVFYVLATTVLPCLGTDDVVVKYLGFASVEVSDATRALRFAFANGIGFVISNIFCWILNRRFVFQPGKFVWWHELGLFMGVSALAMLIATGLSAFLITYIGLMTTFGFLIEVFVSFALNFLFRKCFIFKG